MISLLICAYKSRSLGRHWRHLLASANVGHRASLWLGKMIILLSLNITMNQVGGASVIAKFSRDIIIQGYTLIQSIPSTQNNRYV